MNSRNSDIKTIGNDDLGLFQDLVEFTHMADKGNSIRQVLERPIRHFGPAEERQEAEENIRKLTLALWEMGKPPERRSMAGLALGRIGGFVAAEKLLTRLDYIFAPFRFQQREQALAETKPVLATLVEALALALDKQTLEQFEFPGFDHSRNQLQTISQDILHWLQTGTPDPDLTTAAAISLARLAIRAPLIVQVSPQLFTLSEPAATLAKVGVLGELLDQKLDAAGAFEALQEMSQRTFDVQERERLLSLARQYRQAQINAKRASDSYWQRVEDFLSK